MITKVFFEKGKTFHVASYKEMIQLCQSLRSKDKETPYTIYIDEEGDENKNLKFPFSYFRIINRERRLVSSLYAKKLDEDGNELTTWKTAALKVTGSHNLFENLIVSNDSLHPEIKGQEVALGVYGDDNVFLNCQLDSTQDTLFAGPLPDDLCTRYIDFLPQDERYYEGNPMNYFLNCTISGTVDFIFGAGRAIFDRCSLITLEDKRGETYVVAPSHSLKDDFGYLFYECQFLKGQGVKENSTFLSRPWRDYGKAVFADCSYCDHISKEGFHDWSDVNRIRTARFEEYPLKDGRAIWTKNQIGDTLPFRYEDAILKIRKNYH